MSRLVCIFFLVTSLNVFGKTYVIPSANIECDGTLEVSFEGILSHFAKNLKVRLVGEKEQKEFRLVHINQYYDSVWLDYEAQDGEVLEYYWDDGYGISEGFRFRGCIYEI